MVNTHAFRLVPGWNEDCLSHALTRDSWTRSSALSAFWDSDMAKARRLGMAPSRSCLKLEAPAISFTAMRGSRLFAVFELLQEVRELVGHLFGNEFFVILLELAPDLGIRS